MCSKGHTYAVCILMLDVETTDVFRRLLCSMFERIVSIRLRMCSKGHTYAVCLLMLVILDIETIDFAAFCALCFGEQVLCYRKCILQDTNMRCIEQFSPSKLSTYSGAFCALCSREQVVGGRECVLKDIGMRITNCRVDLDIETIDIFRRLLSAMF